MKYLILYFNIINGKAGYYQLVHGTILCFFKKGEYSQNSYKISEYKKRYHLGTFIYKKIRKPL